jgi:hypothetical protein
MPIKSLRRAAGFVLADGMHHNIRTTVEPDPEDGDLLDAVFPFVKGCLAAVLAAKAAETDGSQSYLNTAVCFLELLGHLALVFLQDAAAMVVLHPERGDNTMYKHLPGRRVSYRLQVGGLLTWVGPAVSDIGRKDGIDGAWYAYE